MYSILLLLLEFKQPHMIRDNVKSGDLVYVVKKEDQPTGKLTKEIVKDILTKRRIHTRGIKVRLKDGTIGRVQHIIT